MGLVSTRYKRDRRYDGQMVRPCELREGRTKEQAKAGTYECRVVATT